MPSTDSLAVWSPTPVEGEVTALAGLGLRAAAALHSGKVVVSVDGGFRWTVADPIPGAPAVTALLLLPEAVLAGTAGQGLVRGEGGEGRGIRTEHLSGRTVLTLAQRGGVLLAGTLRAGVFRSMDEGRSWHTASTGLPLLGDGLEVTHLARTRRAWYALHPFGVSESRDEGLHWRHAVTGLPPHRVPSVLVAARDVLYAEVGARLYRLDPSHAAGWVAGNGLDPLRLVGQVSDALYAVLPDGRTLGRSPDAGRSWASVQRGLPADGLVTAVAATRRAALVALDDGGLWVRRAQTVPDAAVAAKSRVTATLQANLPNPFAHTTALGFALSAEAEVVLTVHDVRDDEVGRLAEGAYPAGEHRVVFEAGTLPAGFYHARLLVDGHRHDRSMLLLR